MHIPCPNSQRPAILQDRIPGTWQKKPSPDLLQQKIKDIQKEPQHYRSFAAFDIPFPSNQAGWEGVKI